MLINVRIVTYVLQTIPVQKGVHQNKTRKTIKFYQMMFLYFVLNVNMYIFVAINVSKIVLNITRNFAHRYLNCKNDTETR